MGQDSQDKSRASDGRFRAYARKIGAWPIFGFA
jgi:hypothetical protein